MPETAHSYYQTKRRIYLLCFSIKTPIGKIVSLFWGAMALLIVLVEFMRMGGLGFNFNHPSFYHQMDIIFVVLFSFEYLMRLWVTPKFVGYATSVMGLIDLITTLSLYLILLFPEMLAHYENLLRLGRILCILRLFKLLGVMDDVAFFHRCILKARSKLVLFLFCIAIVAMMSGGIMFVIEGPQNGFTNLGSSIYWAVVTLATVGYGDITPHTSFGRIIASMLIILGYLSLAIPTSILSAYVMAERERKISFRCPVCKHMGHERDARYCKHCGGKLNNN
ncbi:ion transporter [Jinshanibacter sp. LJY008]|uniref:Ion transporter n=1 Tax=Limnobaculum eriocheiris TaxID=2897391 RepID=A0A9X1MWH0_9GAMM|nr:ion transporter [Limnobaculum eriocheiris]MCD1126991.1 ion transporter [Limnobaculum eriocheiris]